MKNLYSVLLAGIMIAFTADFALAQGSGVATGKRQHKPMTITKMLNPSASTADSNHDKWIDVLSIDWGIYKDQSTFHPAQRNRLIDSNKPTPILIGLLLPAVQKVREAAARNRGIVPNMILTDKRDANGYYRYELKNVLVSSYSVSGSAQSDVPVEDFSLNFEEIKVSYVPNRGRQKTLYEYKYVPIRRY